MQQWWVAFVWLVTAGGPAAVTTPATYGPAFSELGTDAAQSHFAPGPQVVVNRFGGNLMAQSTDVDLPSLGGFSLRFARTHNSGGAQDTSYGRARRLEGPLGLGWTAHYGLVLVHPSNDATWITGSGTRRHFYRHDTLAALQVKSSRPIVRQWIDDALNVLAEHADHTLTLFAADGLRTTFTWVRNDGREGTYVAQEITDDAGNKWSLTYERDWWHDYPLHPVVHSLADEQGRTLSFRYQKVAAHPRLVQINLDGKPLGFYDYRTAPEGAYLSAYKTAAGRRTSYTYHAAEPQVGALSGLTLPTGGQYAFGYQERAFYFPGHKVLNLVVDSVRRGHDTWHFHYPTETGSSHQFEVRTQGPHGYNASHSYHSYSQGHCSGTQLWRLGQLAAATTSVNNTTYKQTFTYEPLKISTAALVGPCPHEPASTARTVKHTQLRDGHTHTVDYGAFNYLAPGQVDGPGNRHERLEYFNLLRPDLYRLAAPAARTVFVGSDVVEKIAMGPYGPQARPTEIKIYRTPQDAVAVALSYHDQAGKRGALASKRYGGYHEGFDYNYGQLSKHSFPEGADDTRTIAPDGTVTQQVQNGVTTSYAYDQDGRVVRVAPPLDTATTLSYGSNDVSIRQGPRHVRHDYDAWGQLSQTSSTMDGGSQTTRYSYDGLGRQVRQVSPLGLATDFDYDVHGRLRRTANVLSRTDYSYQTSANHTQVTRVENGSVTRVHVQDLAGRTLRHALNNYDVRIDHHGITQTTHAGGKTVVQAIDFFGNLLSERRPEFAGTSQYHYDNRGWLTRVDLPSGTVHYRRDGRGRLTEERGTGGERRSFRYHPRYGQLVAATTAEAERTMKLDAQGRVSELVQTVQPRAVEQGKSCPRRIDAAQTLRFATQLAYDDLGRLVRFDHPYGGMAQQIAFGPGFAAETKRITLGRQDVLHNASYGPHGTLTSASFVNGAGAVQYRASYDELGRPTAYGYGGSAHLDVAQVRYNDWGFVERESQRANDGTTTLAYNYGPQGELTSYHRQGGLAGDFRYTYDAHGNLTGRQASGHAALQAYALRASYDGSDHRLGDDYDRAGRLVASGDWHYAYDGFDRLISAISPANQLAYDYDASGARVRAATAQWATYDFRLPDGRLIEQVRFAPDAQGCLQQQTSDFAYLGHYPVAVEIQRSDAPATRRLELRSPSGTLVAVLDEPRGPQVAYLVLGPYGEVLLNPENASHHLFAGHFRDTVTGLDDLTARNYAATSGQFTTLDPVRDGTPEFPFALNLYAYARNNPVSFADPDGRDWVINEFGEKTWEGSDGVLSTAFPWEYLQAGRALGAILSGAVRKGGQFSLQTVSRQSAKISSKDPAFATDARRKDIARRFFDNTEIHERVERMRGVGDYHNFPLEVEAFAEEGKVILRPSGDGVVREELHIKGWYKGKEGRFEFIKDTDASIKHRLFRPDKKP